MVKIVEMPKLFFKCTHCGATCEGEDQDFILQHTRPPTWRIICAYCFLTNTVSPQPLISKYVGALC